MPFIESPTTFYMGRYVDPNTHQMSDTVLYYDSRDLTTHAVILGMTGSGKTGLGITLLEEAVIDNVPAIIIDPKGDITNLLLTFPELRPEDFLPWVNVDDARRAGMDINAYAKVVAERWRQGLAEWDITSQRLRMLKESAHFSIYTPGSDAGLPISILDAMQAPRGGWQPGEDELHRERISGIVTALLALVGRNVEPVRDREHVLISNIFEHAWRSGRDLTLEDVIRQVQKPPFTTLGVFDVDTVFPEKERFALAMELNNIIAAPSFRSWIQGEPLDIQSLLYTPDGRPRVSVFYIAHLSEAERMFIVTLLLENTLAWMRTLSGTTSLRALFYFDEVFGYFPPHPYNPPSKEPIMRMLKQARAFGVGTILATQNPADIDYKGLANAGTWFIGKLQTENDKKRLLAGLESVVSAGGNLNIEDVRRLLGQLRPREFVLHNVHNQNGPQLFHTRWAMSYLRGPLTRQQIRQLMSEQRSHPMYRSAAALPPSMPPATMPPPPPTLPEMPSTVPPAPSTMPEMGAATGMGGGLPPAPPRPAQSSATVNTVPPSMPPTASYNTAPPPGTTMSDAAAYGGGLVPSGFGATQPPLPSSVAQYFLPVRASVEQAASRWEQEMRRRLTVALPDARLAYLPVLLAQAEVRYADRKSGLSLLETYTYLVPDVQRAGLVRWEEFRAEYIDPRDVEGVPREGALFGALPPGLSQARRLSELKRELADYLYKMAAVVVWYNRELDMFGEPGMSKRDFLVQAAAVARQRRDAEVDKIALRYDDKFDRLESKLRKAARDLQAERQQSNALRSEELFTMGEAALSLLRGRTTYTLSRVSRSRRFRQRAEDGIFDAQQRIAELEAEMQETEAEMRRELARVDRKWQEIVHAIEEYRITPYKKDIHLSLFGVGWWPHWLLTANGQAIQMPAWP